MSENANDKLDVATPAADQPTERALGRRLFLFKAAAVVTGAAAVTTATAIATSTEAEAQWCSDRDPYDPRGRGRWCRRGYRRRVGRWCRDRDPRDPRTYRC